MGYGEPHTPLPYFLNKESSADVMHYWAISHSTSTFISWKIAIEWMGLIRRLEVRIKMHFTAISNAFPMRTTNLHTSLIIEYQQLSTNVLLVAYGKTRPHDLVVYYGKWN